MTGDRYGGEWPRERFKPHGVTCEVADKTRSDLYLSLVPSINSGRVRPLDNNRWRTSWSRWNAGRRASAAIWWITPIAHVSALLAPLAPDALR